MSMTEPESKQLLRRQALKARSGLPPQVRAEYSEVICRSIRALDVYQKASTVLYYVPFRQEADILPLLQEGLALGRRCLLPRCQSDWSLQVCEILNLETDLLRNHYGLQEPVTGAISLQSLTIDAVIVPGLAYDRRGNRLGYGKGCYDRLLASLTQTSTLIAPAFEVQVLSDIPICETDIPVHTIVTERRKIDCRAERNEHGT